MTEESYPIQQKTARSVLVNSNLSNPMTEITNLRHDSKSWKTKLTLLLASSLTIMTATTIAPSLPAMNQHFKNIVADPDLRATLVQLVITLPALFIVIGSPIAGIVVDRFGRKPLLLVATLLYGLAGSSGIYLESLSTLLVGRAMLGLAVAGIMVSATTLIADYYSGSTRATFMGLQSGFMGLGGVLFLTLGGIFAQQNWHYPFGIYLFAWLIVPLIALFIFEPYAVEPISERSSYPYIGAETDMAIQSIPIGVIIVVYGLTTFIQIAFYLIPVQLPFFPGGFGAGCTFSNWDGDRFLYAFCSDLLGQLWQNQTAYGVCRFSAFSFWANGYWLFINRSVIKLVTGIDRTGSLWNGARTFNAQYVNLAHDHRT